MCSDVTYDLFFFRIWTCMDFCPWNDAMKLMTEAKNIRLWIISRFNPNNSKFYPSYESLEIILTFLCLNGVSKTKYIWMAAYYMKIIFFNIRIPGKLISSSTYDSTTFSRINSVHPMTQAASENIHSNPFIIQANNHMIRIDSWMKSWPY